MNACEPVRDHLSDGDLTPDVRRHLRECEDCRTFAEGLDALLHHAPALVPDAPAGLAPRVLAGVEQATGASFEREPGGSSRAAGAVSGAGVRTGGSRGAPANSHRSWRPIGLGRRLVTAAAAGAVIVAAVAGGMRLAGREDLDAVLAAAVEQVHAEGTSFRFDVEGDSRIALPAVRLRGEIRLRGEAEVDPPGAVEPLPQPSLAAPQPPPVEMPEVPVPRDPEGMRPFPPAQPVQPPRGDGRPAPREEAAPHGALPGVPDPGLPGLDAPDVPTPELPDIAPPDVPVPGLPETLLPELGIEQLDELRDLRLADLCAVAPELCAHVEVPNLPDPAAAYREEIGRLARGFTQDDPAAGFLAQRLHLALELERLGVAVDEVVTVDEQVGVDGLAVSYSGSGRSDGEAASDYRLEWSVTEPGQASGQVDVLTVAGRTWVRSPRTGGWVDVGRTAAFRFGAVSVPHSVEDVLALLDRPGLAPRDLGTRPVGPDHVDARGLRVDVGGARVDVWLGVDDGLPRRVIWRRVLGEDGGFQVTSRTTFTLYDFGTRVDLAPPAQSRPVSDLGLLDYPPFLVNIAAPR